MAKLVNEVSMTVHGLAADNGNVRAEVFIEKLKAILSAIKVADRFQNGRLTHSVVIVDLKIGSASVRLREKVAVHKGAHTGSIGLVGEALQSVYNGDVSSDRFPTALIKCLVPLTRGVDRKFSHGDVEFSNDNIVRIDDFLANQMKTAIRAARGQEAADEGYFKGLSFGSFDGILREIDARGAFVRGKLILTAGGKEIDCVFKQDEIPLAVRSFDKRTRIEALAHYDGECPLPVRLDVKHIYPTKIDADLIKWKGVFERPAEAV
jgi:hypothetical protein